MALSRADAMFSYLYHFDLFYIRFFISPSLGRAPSSLGPRGPRPARRLSTGRFSPRIFRSRQLSQRDSRGVPRLAWPDAVMAATVSVTVKSSVKSGVGVDATHTC